jgi:hypothetical protein
MERDIFDLARELMSWLFPIISLLGVIVCAVNLRQSRWVGLVLFGFMLQLGIGVAVRLDTTVIVIDHFFRNHRHLFVFAVGLGDVISQALIIGGLAARFGDFRRRLTSPKQTGPIDEQPFGADVVPRRLKREGSRDIQP